MLFYSVVVIVRLEDGLTEFWTSDHSQSSVLHSKSWHNRCKSSLVVHNSDIAVVDTSDHDLMARSSALEKLPDPSERDYRSTKN